MRSLTRAVAVLAIAIVLSACVMDAPRGTPHDDPANLALAAERISELRTFRVRLRWDDRDLGIADVQAPDTMRVRGPDAEWLADPGSAWRAGPSGPERSQPGESVQAARDALRVARSLGNATEITYVVNESSDAYTAHKWTFRLGAERGIVLITVRDNMPRHIELTGAGIRKSYDFIDYNASISVRLPQR